MRRELVCFYSKVDFTEAVLGFGLSVRYTGKGKGREAGVLDMSSELELLSYESFAVAGVRASAWKRPFEHWLPVLLDADHAERALPLVERSLMAIVQGIPKILTAIVPPPFDPLVALTLLPKLLNNMTVSLMRAGDHASLHAVSNCVGCSAWAL